MMGHFTLRQILMKTPINSSRRLFLKRAMNESHKVMLGRFFDERVSVLLRASLDDYCSEDRIVSMIDSQLDDLNDHRPMFTLKSFVFCHYFFE